MLITIEGMDGSGKSSLVEDLEDLIPSDDVEVLHRGPLRRSPLEEYEYSIHHYRHGNHDIIADRWHVGELFYGPLYRGESQLTPAQAYHVEMFLKSRGALRIMLDTPLNVITWRLRRRGEDFLKPEHYGMAWDFYREYAAEHGWLIVNHEYDRNELLQLMNRAMFLQVQATGLPRSYVGDLKPEFILLHANKHPGREPATTAMTPVRGTPEHYMMSALQLAGVTKFGIMNEFELGEPVDEFLPSALRKLGNPIVVALGNVAATACRRFGIRHMETYTPSAIRRRQPENTADYVREILDYVAAHRDGRTAGTGEEVSETGV